MGLQEGDRKERNEEGGMGGREGRMEGRGGIEYGRVRWGERKKKIDK